MTRWKANSSVLNRLLRLAHSLVGAKHRRGTTQQASITDNKSFDTPAPLGEEHLQVIGSFRQGDVVTIDGLPVLGPDAVWLRRTPHGAVLLTQTCDAVRPEKPTVALAPIARLEGGNASEARDGKLLRYIPLPSTEPEAFADLSVIATIDKALFAALPRTAGIDQTDDDAVRKVRTRRRQALRQVPVSRRSCAVAPATGSRDAEQTRQEQPRGGRHARRR